MECEQSVSTQPTIIHESNDMKWMKNVTINPEHKSEYRVEK